RVVLSREVAEVAQARRFRIAVVLHTTSSDWARQLVGGIVKTLGEYGAAVIDVTDCHFSSDRQVEALRRLLHEKADAIISLPVDNAAVADAHRTISGAGIKLILLDNAPTGLLPGRDYTCVVSADNFGLGRIGASLLLPHVAYRQTIGILAYGADFYVTNERVIGFLDQLETSRPDVVVRQAKFTVAHDAGSTLNHLLDAHPE